MNYAILIFFLSFLVVDQHQQPPLQEDHSPPLQNSYTEFLVNQLIEDDEPSPASPPSPPTITAASQGHGSNHMAATPPQQQHQPHPPQPQRQPSPPAAAPESSPPQQQHKQPQPDQQIPSVQQIQWFYLDPQRNEQVRTT